MKRLDNQTITIELIMTQQFKLRLWLATQLFSLGGWILGRSNDVIVKRMPVPMLLWCPVCFHQHVDEPDEATGWNNPPHRTHQCQVCNHTWRPSDVETTGVEEIQTCGQNDGSPIPQVGDFE